MFSHLELELESLGIVGALQPNAQLELDLELLIEKSRKHLVEKNYSQSYEIAVKAFEKTKRLSEERPFILVMLAAACIGTKDFNLACIYYREAGCSVDQRGFTENATLIHEIVKKLEKLCLQ